MALLVSKLDREASLTRKFSIIHYSKNLYSTALKALENTQSQSNPSKKGIIGKVKQLVRDEIRSLWDDKVKGLLVQGKFLAIVELEKSCLTWKHIIYQLPRGVLQFALNAATDTLPTLVNLQRWHIRSGNAKCPLCQNSQTLHHVLNYMAS